MLERFSVNVATTTILAVLGKLALLYHADKEAGNDWFTEPVQQNVLCLLLVCMFLMFFRGKMMHDDASFFTDLEEDRKKGVVPETLFQTDDAFPLLIKGGIVVGYLSWLLWAPAIYFLEERGRFVGFLIASLCLSTVWLVIDILTRRTRDWRRAFWIVPNAVYIGLLFLLTSRSWPMVAAVGLIIVLIGDWLISDPFSQHINKTTPLRDSKATAEAKPAEFKGGLSHDASIAIAVVLAAFGVLSALLSVAQHLRAAPAALWSILAVVFLIQAVLLLIAARLTKTPHHSAPAQGVPASSPTP